MSICSTNRPIVYYCHYLDVIKYHIHIDYIKSRSEDIKNIKVKDLSTHFTRIKVVFINKSSLVV